MTPEIECRPLDDRHLDAAGRLLVDAYPYRAHEPRSWRQYAEREEAQRWGAFQITTTTADDERTELMAYSALWRVEAQKFRFDAVVSPPWTQRGLGHRLVELVVHEAR